MGCFFGGYRGYLGAYLTVYRVQGSGLRIAQNGGVTFLEGIIPRMEHEMKTRIMLGVIVRVSQHWWYLLRVPIVKTLAFWGLYSASLFRETTIWVRVIF